MISTVVGVILVAAGVIVRFAIPATFAQGLPAHLAGVIVMLGGILGLMLSLLVWGPLGRRRNDRRRFRWRNLPAWRRNARQDRPPSPGSPKP